MVRIPRSIRSALALDPRAAAAPPECAADSAARALTPRRRFYAELERGGELYTHPVLAATFAEAEERARIHCRGRGYRFDRVDPEWDAIEIAGRLTLRIELKREEAAAPCAQPSAAAHSIELQSSERSGVTAIPTAPSPVSAWANAPVQAMKQARNKSAIEPSLGNDLPKGVSSPVCYAGEMDPHYAGYLDRAELLALLNLLLESARAGAKALKALLDEGVDDAVAPVLAGVRRDEARYVALLSRAVRDLGGEPSKATGACYANCLAIEGLHHRLELLDRGQDLVARKLKEALPRIRDDALHGRLQEMLATHEANIGRCEAILTAAAASRG